MRARTRHLLRWASGPLVLAASVGGTSPAALAGPSPAVPRPAGEVAKAVTIEGTYSPFRSEDATTGYIQTADRRAALVHFPGPIQIEAGASITVTARRAATAAPSYDVESITSLRPPTVEAGAKASLASTPTTMHLLIIPVWCSHPANSTTVVPGPTGPPSAAFESLVNTTVSPWFKQVSWGHRIFKPTATPYYDICPAWGQLPLDPEALALGGGYPVADFERVVFVGDYSGGGALGAAEDIPGRRAMLYGGTLNPGIWSHELGHLEGLVHANSLRCLQSPGPVPVTYTLAATCTSNEYGDPADTMGDWVPYPGFSSAQADQLGWLDPNGPSPNIRTFTTSGSLLIADYAAPPSSLRQRAVKIELPSGTYYVDRRNAVGFDSGLAGMPGLTNGVQLHLVAGNVDSSTFLSTWARHANLLDANPATPTFTDAALPFGVTFTTPEGVAIRAAQAGADTKVIVSFPPGLSSPSNPRNVQTTVNPSTGMALVTWDPPLLNPTGLTYEIRTSNAALGPFTTTGTSLTIGPVPDGSNAVGVRAYKTTNPTLTSQYAGSPLFFQYPMPTTAPAITVQEHTGLGTTTHQVALTLPWSPAGGATRNIGLFPGTAQDNVDYLTPLASAVFPQGTTTVNGSFQVVDDNLIEGPEDMELVAVEWRCPAGWYVPACIVPVHLATVTIADDD